MENFECKGHDSHQFRITGEDNSQFDCEVCFCGKIVCRNLPKLKVPKTSAHFVNERRLFYEYSSDAREEWKPNLEKEREKSSLYVAAQGERGDEVFKGYCSVCKSNFRDYRKHINRREHKAMIGLS